jgi:hypothetical protein
MIKLIVTDNGDRSVGLFPQDYIVELPMDIPDAENIEPFDLECMEWFKAEIINIFDEFSNGKVTAKYNFE